MRARSIIAVVGAVVLAGAAEGCRASSSAGVAEMQGEPARETWATVHRDVTGWVVHPLDLHGADGHVDDLDTSAVREVFDQDAPIVVRGTMRGSAFAVDGVYRSLPGGTWSPDDTFVRLEKDLPVLLNRDVSVEVAAIDLSRVQTDWIDHRWLDNRVHQRGAVMAGRFVGEPGHGVERFEATAVFVPLPDRAASCKGRVRRCPAGTVPTYARDPDRCLVFSRCVAPAACPSRPPPCAPGYALRSWRSPPHACLDYACDAAFLPE